MSDFATFLSDAAGVAWGLPFILMLGSVGLFYTIKLGVPQFRRFRHAVRIGAGKHDEPDDPGEVTHFQALCAALSATVGVGNIAGVATAITAGGPGAAVWMMLFGLLGMMTKFASCTLAIRYRVYAEDGSILGGPMESIQRGLGKRFHWLAVAFAVCALIASFGGGNMVQANEMANAFTSEFSDFFTGISPSLTEPIAFMGSETDLLRILLGATVAIVVASVIIGGMKRIGQVASILVPVMAIFYVGGAGTIILLNLGEVPAMVGEMFKLAFFGGTEQVAGGAIGYTVLQAMTWGARRAVFSNEAGLGSAPIAHAAARTKEPIREGLVAMLEPFIDTVVICTMTALVILLTDAHLGDHGLNGAALTRHAFGLGLSSAPWLGTVTVSIGLIMFAISTAISWSYYGDRCATFLFGPWAVKPYRVLYVLVLFLGANLKGGLVWSFSDVANAGMAFWHIVALLGLSPVVVMLYKDYFSKPQIPHSEQHAQAGSREGGDS